MENLTVIYLTASKISKNFGDYQRSLLKDAIGDYPLISVSREPLDFGLNILDDGEKSTSNIYRQMLRACKVATTDYIAIAEDDTLYCKDHFNFYRPPLDTFCYNQNRFALFTWSEPIFSWRNRKSNCSLIAPRLLLIEALEERFAKFPNGTPDNITGEVGRGRVERNLGITVRKSEEKFSEVSIIQINHDTASEDRQVRHRKKLGQIKVYDLYYWGRPEEVLKNYEK